MDFYKIIERVNKSGTLEVYPDFEICRSKDLMIRGKNFYAIWDESRQIWSTDEYDLQMLVDSELFKYKDSKNVTFAGVIDVKRLGAFDSYIWTKYKKYLSQMYDNYHILDNQLTFLNTEVKKTDYVSKKLPYPLEAGSIAAYEELITTLYEDEERKKLEWAVGAIISGDSKSIQKFIVLYGDAGSGKSTFLNIVQKLFEGYYTAFDGKALTSANNNFSTEMFRNNPLVAIQHDGDLSKIEDNTKLNSVVSHEEMTMSEKYKPSYMSRINCFLFMGTNKPVKITDAKAGIIRRLIDVKPTGIKVPNKRYHTLMAQIDFELGAIAHHCLNTYREMGKNYYSGYRPIDMMYKTDMFFNFIEDNYYVFKEQNGTTLAQAHDMYKVYCAESSIDYKMPRYKLREELKDYFKCFSDTARIDGKQVRSYYSGFLKEKFTAKAVETESKADSLVIDSPESTLNVDFKNCPAQYASENEVPLEPWSKVQTTLKDIDTTKLHYVKPPANYIVIDFDLKDDTGKKSLDLNFDAASKWPPTYAEFSKSGNGIHLHYMYDGNIHSLNNIYSEGIEVKTFNGRASLRRKFTKSNNIPITTINGGIPLKGEKMINFDAVKSEKGIRDLIDRNIKKEFHAGTKPSIDFIDKILKDACTSGLKFNVTDMRPRILAFANNSSNQADYCIKLVSNMVFKSDEPSESPEAYQSDEIIFFDVEVFPNLFIICWKAENKDPVKMINPTAKDVEELMKFKLVGYNCRRYDNHILYARYIGYDNLQLYNLSQRIINNARSGLFGEAYNISYTDVYDFSSKKQSLKKFQVELGIYHKELGLPWDEPVDESMWDLVADYCVNDIVSLQAVFEDRKQDFIARLILSDLSGLTPNSTTQQHTAKIMFGNDKTPQEKFIYTDLSKMFPGYKYEGGKSIYRGEETGEGGYVYSEPGVYQNVVTLDIASMHPTSLVELDMFGPYTKQFKELMDARLAIKHKDYDLARTMLGGILSNYLTSDGDSGALAYALKIVINSVYGLTSAKFENKFKDPRNKDNIVAKRGALFMVDLKHAVQDKGVSVIHIKTDSIKIPNATPEIIEFITDFGKQYGYTFETEDVYQKFCLLNDAVYIAQKPNKQWTAVGAQFAQPYVYKTLFSKEEIEFKDLCVTKAVTSALYLDMNEQLSDGEHNYHFVGKVGSFCPIKLGLGGGLLLRQKDDKYYAATGTKGYRWLEADVVSAFNKEDLIDRRYFLELVNEAVADISVFGDFDWFIGKKQFIKIDDYPIGINDTPPWLMPCGDEKYATCFECPHYDDICKLGYDLSDVISVNHKVKLERGKK